MYFESEILKGKRNEKKTNGLASTFLSLQFIPLPNAGIATRDHEEQYKN